MNTTEDSIKQARVATDILMLNVTEESLAQLMRAAQRAENVFAQLLTQVDFKLSTEELASLSKQKFTEASATADGVRKSRLALTMPREGHYFSAAQDGTQWIVSNPSSPFLGLGMKGCGGPNVVHPLVCAIDDAPLSVTRAGLCDTYAALRLADAACEASLVRVLHAYAVLIEQTPLLDGECKSVLLKLLEVFHTGATNRTAEYGFEVISMFQGLGDATFPWPHFQQMLRIASADKVARALRPHFDTAQVHAAMQAYCSAQASYAVSMAETYSAKFVPLKRAIIVAERMERARPVLVIDIDETLVHASNTEIESGATRVEVTWEPDAQTMERYTARVLAQKCAHLQLSGKTATSTVIVSDARMQMFGRLLRGRAFRLVFFASANNDGRTSAVIAELRKRDEYAWVRSVVTLPRSASMVGVCDAREQKKSIAAIRNAMGVPDEVVVVMVDDKASEVVGAGTRDALISVRPFAGTDTELDATEEKSIENEIVARAAAAASRTHECKRKRDV